jgi:hypothetical protein
MAHRLCATRHSGKVRREYKGGPAPTSPKLVYTSDSQLRPVQHAAEQKLADFTRDFHAVPVKRIFSFAPFGPPHNFFDSALAQTTFTLV